ncbi:MAG: cupin domain-containing protein [Gammaproteobacteria bacterium]|jgi:quercetin dioxygenase-like cupin family protein|nr:cupin domain-containing protein [Gammaproteobacteria bacterium]
MALPQNISPINPELMDTLVKASSSEWIPQPMDPEKAFIRVLYTGAESGRWAVHFRWLKGFVAPPHKHLSASHTFILSGKLQVRDGTLDAGDYVYEPNGMIHGATTALEDTEYLFICDGPVLFFDDNGFTAYLGWEELRRMQQGHAARKTGAKAKSKAAAKPAAKAKAAAKPAAKAQAKPAARKKKAA